jgi:hypothetical protein
MKITVGKILSSVMAVFLLILGIFSLVDGQFVSGLIFLGTGAFAAPATRARMAAESDIEFSRWIVIIILIGGTLGGAAFLDTDDSDQTSTLDSVDESQPETSSANDEVITTSAEQMLPTIDQFDAGWIAGDTSYNSSTQTAEAGFFNDQAFVFYGVTRYDTVNEAEQAYDRRVSQIRQDGLATDDGNKGDEGMLYKYSNTHVVIEFRESNVVGKVEYYNELALTPELNTDSMARKLERNIG